MYVYHFSDRILTNEILLGCGDFGRKVYTACNGEILVNEYHNKISKVLNKTIVRGISIDGSEMADLKEFEFLLKNRLGIINGNAFNLIIHILSKERRKMTAQELQKRIPHFSMSEKDEYFGPDEEDTLKLIAYFADKEVLIDKIKIKPSLKLYKIKVADGATIVYPDKSFKEQNIRTLPIELVIESYNKYHFNVRSSCPFYIPGENVDLAKREKSEIAFMKNVLQEVSFLNGCYTESQYSQIDKLQQWLKRRVAYWNNKENSKQIQVEPILTIADFLPTQKKGLIGLFRKLTGITKREQAKAEVELNKAQIAREKTRIQEKKRQETENHQMAEYQRDMFKEAQKLLIDIVMNHKIEEVIHYQDDQTQNMIGIDGLIVKSLLQPEQKYVLFNNSNVLHLESYREIKQDYYGGPLYIDPEVKPISNESSIAQKLLGFDKISTHSSFPYRRMQQNEGR